MNTTEEQLLEDFNREIYDENGAGPVTLEYLIQHLRSTRKRNFEEGPKYREGFKDGYDNGYKMGIAKAEEDTIMFQDLRKMTIQQLANLIYGETDEI
jgi:flagellar biosynthesis/type III secretory pathway protein FliH